MNFKVIQPSMYAENETDWVKDLNQGARSIDDLLEWGIVSADEARQLTPVADQFKFRVGRYYLSLIDRADPNCPIRKQAIPSVQEMNFNTVELHDPTGDGAHRVTPLLVHRYPDRVLLMPTLNCPMYCRYCFRKVGLNESSPSFTKNWQQSLVYLQAHTEIEEVILTGGDPLMVSDKQLTRILDGLRTVPHIRRVRIHTRVPVTLPSRITTKLTDVLTSYFPLYLVTHFNHSRELTAHSIRGLERLRSNGVQLANQSVLLKGVNDDANALRALFGSLLDNGVRPYYLHHPDVTVGTGHLRVSLSRGKRIYQALRGSLSGLAIPSYVMEIPGGGGKILVDGSGVQEVGNGRWRLQSPIDQSWKEWIDPAHRTDLSALGESAT